MPLKIDKINLIAFLRHFYTITGIRIVILDLEFNELLAYPEKLCEFCRFIRLTREGAKRCAVCDANAQDIIRKSNVPHYIYTCHAGLIDSIAPISDEERIVGYMMFGQCISADEQMDILWKKAAALCADFTDIGQMKNEFFALPRMTGVQLEACAQIMNACASYIMVKKYVRLTHDFIFAAVSNYVEAHLTDDLSANILSNRLFLPRNVIYRTIKAETGFSLGQYVRYKRLDHAARLLNSETCSITSIAEMCGVNDSNYFSRLFRRRYGVSPREYRANYRP
jgi:AraC-like DNA-binding protein